MKNKINHFEIKRKILHVIIGIIAILLITYNLVDSLIIFIMLVFGVATSLISLKFRIPLISWFLDNFDREREKNELPGRGVIFAVVGGLLCLQLFQRDVALASITILTFADPISHLVGKYFGKTPSLLDSRKNIEGHIAGAIISSLMAMFFVSPHLAIAGAMAAMLFESIIIEIQKIQLDDNLIIPLAAGTTMLLIIKVLT